MALVRHHFLPIRWVLGAIFLLSAPTGCGEKDPGKTNASSSGATAAPVATVDVEKYCERVCAKSTKCGLEAAEKIVEAKVPGEMSALEKLRNSAKEQEATCVKGCTADTPSASDQDKLKKAEKCLDQTECTTFVACLNDAAGIVIPTAKPATPPSASAAPSAGGAPAPTGTVPTTPDPFGERK